MAGTVSPLNNDPDLLQSEVRAGELVRSDKSASRSPDPRMASEAGTPTNGSASRPVPKRRPTLVLGSLAIVAVGIGAIVKGPDLLGSGAKIDSSLVTESARKAPFRVVISERGQLDSQRNAILASKVEGQVAIISIAPEGTAALAPVKATLDGTVVRIDSPSGDRRTIAVAGSGGEPTLHEVPIGPNTQVLVKKGDVVKAGDMLAADLLCELNASDIIKEEKQQQIAMTKADADLKIAIEEIETQKGQNESDVAAAKLAKKLADLDLAKFEKGDSVQQAKAIKAKITLAEEVLARAEEDYAFTKRVSKKGYKTQNQVNTLRIARNKAQIERDIAVEELRLLENFTFERTNEELKAVAAESVRELERAKRRGVATLTQLGAERAARQLTFDVESSKLERLRKQIAACKIYAPQSGEVVYANDSNNWGGSQQVIEEHATVRERQKIIKLPKLDDMKIDARVHESRISQVRAGLPVIIRVDAFQGRVFHGIVASVSSVPLTPNRRTPDLRQYKTVIHLTDDLKKVKNLKPGLTAKIEIIVEQRDNILQVPVQAINAIGRKHFAFVVGKDGAKQREVLVGKSNDTTIEILDGVAEGEQVVLNPRTHFGEKLAKLEAKYGEKTDKAKDGEFADFPAKPPQAERPQGRPQGKPGGNQDPQRKRRPGGRPSGQGGPSGKGKPPGGGGQR
jgi:multidrug resistance efflux pump